MDAARYYRLEGKIPVPCDQEAWAYFLEHGDRVVAFVKVADVEVSTVFIGFNYRFGMSDVPCLFETMIFGGEHDGYQWRTSTWELALERHHKAMELVKSSLT